jgi:hypothetical protein
MHIYIYIINNINLIYKESIGFETKVRELIFFQLNIE